MTEMNAQISPVDIENAMNAVQDFVQRMSSNIQSEMLAVAELAKEAAQGYCPVETGTLRDSIAVQSLEDDGSSYSVGVGTNISYAPYVELGHRTRGGGSFVAPQPFLQPAFEEMSQTLHQRLQALADQG